MTYLWIRSSRTEIRNRLILTTKITKNTKEKKNKDKFFVSFVSLW